MMSLLDPRVWCVVLALCLASFFGGQWQESRISTAKMKEANAAAMLELELSTRRVQLAERTLQQTITAVHQARTKEQDHAKTTIDALRADVRAGAVRLSIATRSRGPAASGADPGTGAAEERAELVPAAAIALIDIAADGDDAVRDLNACIDQYNAVRRAINP